MLYSTTLSLIRKVFCKWFSFSSKSTPIDILPWFRVMQSMKGMGALSFLRNSVLGTYRFYTTRTRTKKRASTRFSHGTTLSARKPVSFWQGKRDIVVILVQGFAKMLSCQIKLRPRWQFVIFRSAKRLSYQ